MNAFSWQGQPSAIDESLKPSPMARTSSSLAPRRLHTCQAAKASPERALEAQIEQVNREVEQHFLMAQHSVLSEQDRLFHRDEARRLAAKVKTLVSQRSPEYVAQLEQERGLG